MRRQRSAKRLGTRHDLNYFKRWTGMRKLRLGLAVVIPVIAVLWIVSEGLRGASHPVSSGPLSRAHSFFANDCSACHANIVNGVKRAGFVQHSSDAACLTCHAAPAHQPNQTFTPECSSCHLEHEGAMRLAQVPTRNCTQCHADLRTSDRKMHIAGRITSFNNDHPEFAALRVRESDPGTIAFNHAIHLQPVQGPDGKKVELECADCHRTGAEQGAVWRFAVASFKPTITSDRSYMVAPTYAKNCAACHDLRFDEKVAEGAPHDRPEVVMAFLQKVYSGPLAASAHPQPVRLIPSSASLFARSTDQRLAVASRLLWGKTCKECHQLEFPKDAALPSVAPSQITTVWFKQAKFSHDPHRSVACTSCHEQSPTSQQTSDVLIPSIAICQTCHNGDPQQTGHSENRCFECHDYHDWKQQPAFKGNYVLDKLRKTKRN